MFNSICCVSVLEIKVWTGNQKSLYSQNLQFNYFPTYTRTLELVAYPFPDLGIQLESPAMQVDSLPTELHNL